jgi:hypothetical protein
MVGAERCDVTIAGVLAHCCVLTGVTEIVMIFKVADPPQVEVEQTVVTTV